MMNCFLNVMLGVLATPRHSVNNAVPYYPYCDEQTIACTVLPCAHLDLEHMFE